MFVTSMAFLGSMRNCFQQTQHRARSFLQEKKCTTLSIAVAVLGALVMASGVAVTLGSTGTLSVLGVALVATGAGLMAAGIASLIISKNSAPCEEAPQPREHRGVQWLESA